MGLLLCGPVFESQSCHLGLPDSSVGKESVCNAGVKVKVKSLSSVRLFATPWTVAYHASSSMGFSRQEYWSKLPFPSAEDLPNPGIKPRSPTLKADVLPSEPLGKSFKCFLKEHPYF